MKIAIYGNDKEELEKDKEKLVSNFAKSDMNQGIEVSCFHDENMLKEKWKDFQIILMEKAGVREFKKCVANKMSENKVTFFVGKEVETYYVDDIYYVEADLSRIRLVACHGEYVIPLGISETEKLLEGKGFIKTHRSYLINAKYIKEIKHRMVILENGKELPISKYRIKQVRKMYWELISGKVI